MQILLNFFAPKECLTPDAFCLHIFDNACIGRKAYCYQKGSKLRKKLYSKTCLKMAGGGMHPPCPH